MKSTRNEFKTLVAASFAVIYQVEMGRKARKTNFRLHQIIYSQPAKQLRINHCHLSASHKYPHVDTISPLFPSVPLRLSLMMVFQGLIRRARANSLLKAPN
jgi:hypothetical protein